MPKTNEEIWMDLSVLFFDSPEPKSADMVNAVAEALKLAGWTKIKTEEVLIGIIAPNAKRWLGYGLPLAMGEEIDFWNRDVLIPKMRISAHLREKYPHYFFLLPDFLNRRILRRLGVDRLLNLIQ